MDNHAPIKTKQVSVLQQTKWYNEDIVSTKKARRKVKRRWCSTKLQILLKMYKSERHKVKQLYKNAKWDFYQKENDDYGNEQKKTVQNHRGTDVCS